NPLNRRMRIFAGLIDSGPMNDVWALELAAGAVNVPTAPAPRAAAAALLPPWPNPSRGAVAMEFAPPARAGRFELAVFDAAGRRVRALWSGDGAGAARRATWDGRDSRG